MKFSEITPLQVLGAVLVVNTVLAGGATQLTDLFGAAMANHILSVCVLGSGICGGFIMNMGGLPSQFRNVRAMDGVQQILVNGQASPDIATMAVNPSDSKVAAAPGAVDKVTAIAAKVLILAFALSAFLAVPEAHAQIKKPAIALPFDPLKLNTAAQPAGTAATNTLAGVNFNSIGQKLQAIAKDVIDKGIADLSAASTDAQNHNDLIAKPCWDAQVGFLKQLPAEWQTPPTDVGPALAIQISRDLLNTITGNDQTSLKVACAALIGDQITIINQTLAIIGVAGITGF